MTVERDERMGTVDAAWLHMDSPKQHMVITAAFRFAEPVTLVEVHDLVATRVARHPRFRQRVAPPRVPVGTPHWEEVPDFAPGPHLFERPLDGDDDRALARALSELASTPLDRSRPLWTAHLLTGHADGPVLAVRLHHAIGDGVSLVRLLLALTDHGEAAPQTVGVAAPPRPRGLVARGNTAVGHAAALARMTLLAPDPMTVLRGELGPRKRVAWTRRFGLDALRAAARACDAKLNDLLVAVTAGALRRYLTDRQGLPSLAELRALVPVFLRGADGDGGLGNHFGLVFLPLLVGIGDPRERVRASREANDRVKASADAAVAFEVLAAMGAAGPSVENLGIDLFTRKASVMITNVPGPSGALWMAGHRVVGLDVWAPVAGHIGTGVSLATYDGGVRVGVLSDARLVPDPQAIALAWESEAELLLAATQP